MTNVWLVEFSDGLLGAYSTKDNALYRALVHQRDNAGSKIPIRWLQGPEAGYLEGSAEFGYYYIREWAVDDIVEG